MFSLLKHVPPSLV